MYSSNQIVSLGVTLLQIALFQSLGQIEQVHKKIAAPKKYWLTPPLVSLLHDGFLPRLLSEKLQQLSLKL